MKVVPPLEGAGMARVGSVRSSFAQGLLGNLLNPKAGLVFITMIPAFIHQGDSPLRLLMMLLVFEAIILSWLNCYGYLVVRSGRSRAGKRIRAIMSRITGVVLIGLGARVALERG